MGHNGASHGMNIPVIPQVAMSDLYAVPCRALDFDMWLPVVLVS